MNDRTPKRRAPQDDRGPAGLSPVELRLLGLMKALADPLKKRVLIETSARPMSATMFIRGSGADPDRVFSRFRRLARDGLLEQVGERREPGRRGGAQRLYRSTFLNHLDAAAWRDMPPLVREIVWATCLECLEAAVEAVACTEDEDRRLAVVHTTLDREAWATLDRRLTRLHESLHALAPAAAERIEAGGEEPVPVTVCLFALPGHRAAPPRPSV